MSIDAYRYSAGELRRIRNPLVDFMENTENLAEEPDKAGYYPELHGEYRKEADPLITVYANKGYPEMPAFALDVRGANRRLAWYFADSFQCVVSLIKLLEPLSKNRSWVRGGKS